MRRKLVLGVGLAALVGGTAAGQFAVDRPVSPASPTSPASPAGTPKAAPSPPGSLPSAGGFQPVAPPRSPAPPVSPGTSGYTPLYSSPSPPAPAYVPPTDGFRPAGYASPPAAPSDAGPAAAFPTGAVDAEMPLAVPKDHPWLLKPEHGPWFILVKSYVRPPKGSKAAEVDRGLTALELSEALGKEIRDNFRVQAFLFEYVSEERKAEHRAIVAARHKAQTEYLARVRELEKKARLQGIEFLMPDNKLHVLKHETRDQVGVLVGGFQTEAEAQKALAQLKKWPAPKNELLMDGGAVVKPGPDGKQPVVQSTRLNPYATAFVVPNPSAARDPSAHAARPALDPFIVRLNEGQPYSLLKAKKGWTLMVKAFSSPIEIVNKNADTSLMKKFSLNKGADVLAAGAEQAEELAKAIRAMKGPGGQSLNLEAFVLHTRSTSLVTVGQFDGPEDPALLATKRLLGGIKPRITEDANGLRPASNAPTLFENLTPMPIPKVQ
jgi:hypothetical protein